MSTVDTHQQRNRSLNPTPNLMSPFVPFPLMDDSFFSPQIAFNSMNGGFTSLTNFHNVGGQNANIKRTSTSTSFVNGKKIMTKK